MFETNSSLLATSGTATINGYSGTTINGNCGTTISGNSTLNTFSSLTVQNMRTRQVKAAVFTIERNDKNEVVSSKFVKELWVEIKNGASLDLAVAKELKGDFDPETTVVREIYSLSF
jgi:hypothetical protein